MKNFSINLLFIAAVAFCIILFLGARQGFSKFLGMKPSPSPIKSSKLIRQQDQITQKIKDEQKTQMDTYNENIQDDQNERNSSSLTPQQIRERQQKSIQDIELQRRLQMESLQDKIRHY